MKRVIRCSAFETNSSSQHSIVVTKDDHMLTSDDMRTGWKESEEKELFYINKEGVWDIWGSEDLSFQRYPFDLLSTVEDKARYAIAEYCGEYTRYTDEEKVNFINDLIALLNEVIPRVWDIKLPKQYIDVYKDVDGNEVSRSHYVFRDREAEGEDGKRKYAYQDLDGVKHEVFWDYSEESPNIPGIDHQSAGLLTTFLKKKGITLKDFLFNKKYKVIIDGDEYDTWGKLKESGLIDLNDIVEEFGIIETYLENKGEDYDESEEDE